MRWKKEKTKDGETRIINKFLIFPKTINRETRWLEKASWVEKWGYWGAAEDGPGWAYIDWLENCVLDKLTK